MDEEGTVADHFKYNSAANEIDLCEAEKRLDGLLDRRAKIAERSTFGLLALNGASAVAVFSALQASPLALKALGITPAMLSFSLSAFLLGMVIAVLSVHSETLHLTNTAGAQFARTNVLRNIKKALSDKVRPDAVDRLGKELEGLSSVPPMDFAYSPVQLTLHNFSGSAWLGGMAYLVWVVGRNIVWSA